MPADTLQVAVLSPGDGATLEAATSDSPAAAMVVDVVDQISTTD